MKRLTLLTMFTFVSLLFAQNGMGVVSGSPTDILEMAY